MIVVAIAIVFLILYVCCSFIPVQRVVFPADLENFENAIVVRYGLGPPTDYRIIGDSRGLFKNPSEDYVAVNLLGNVPPGNQYLNITLRAGTQH